MEDLQKYNDICVKMLAEGKHEVVVDNVKVSITKVNPPEINMAFHFFK